MIPPDSYLPMRCTHTRWPHMGFHENSPLREQEHWQWLPTAHKMEHKPIAVVHSFHNLAAAHLPWVSHCPLEAVSCPHRQMSPQYPTEATCLYNSITAQPVTLPRHTFFSFLSHDSLFSNIMQGLPYACQTLWEVLCSCWAT